ncbi:MAG: hypothetical protein Q7U73_14175 [Rubrivivax sp.]|nr:hypothetical protein [Rubrivivax sp.]
MLGPRRSHDLCLAREHPGHGRRQSEPAGGAGQHTYGQLALGSVGYAPERINTDAGFLVCPRLSAEYALAPDLRLSLSAGYMVVPEGTSKNLSMGQGFAELKAGTNVHGLAVKPGIGLRYQPNDRIALRARAGHIEARSAAQRATATAPTASAWTSTTCSRCRPGDALWPARQRPQR